MNLIEQLEQEEIARLGKTLPEFAPGDTVVVQVKVKEVDEADDIFTKLMGDVVEPRREFIQDNALAASVDV